MTVPEVFNKIVSLHADFMSGVVAEVDLPLKLKDLKKEAKNLKLNLDTEAIRKSIIADKKAIDDNNDYDSDPDYSESYEESY